MERDDWPTKYWSTADSPMQEAYCQKLSELSSVIEKEYGSISGIVIIRNGIMIYEAYYRGKGPDDSIHVASVTKSILSALTGIAVKHGYISSVKQRVLDFFPEYEAAVPGGNRALITLENLLTMTAPYSYEDWHEPFEQLCSSPDWIRFILDMLGENGDIGTFKYSTAGAHLLSAILTRATGKSTREFANEMLSAPIGMRQIPDYPMNGYGFDDLFGAGLRGWVHDPHGINTGGWGLTLTPRDMARFGFLYLSNGYWDGQEIISEAWVRASSARNRNRYGYMWWQYDARDIPVFAALGDGGNAVFCIPQRDMVVAVASEFTENPKDRWMLVRDHIL